MPDAPSPCPPRPYTPSLRRPLCPACLRPQRACWCACIRTVTSHVEVLILQHPDEVGHAKNTARLLHLCLPNSRLQVGEVFDPEALQSWLHAPWSDAADSAMPRPLLLYPATAADPQLPVIPAPELPAHWLQRPDRLRLVLIDGTWRKSRKMLYLNPLLQALPRLALQEVPEGRYRIRKAHLPSQLSSFEAGALAVTQLHGAPAAPTLWQPLMQSFDAAMHLHQTLQAAGRAARSGEAAA